MSYICDTASLHSTGCVVLHWCKTSAVNLIIFTVRRKRSFGRQFSGTVGWFVFVVIGQLHLFLLALLCAFTVVLVKYGYLIDTPAFASS